MLVRVTRRTLGSELRLGRLEAVLETVRSLVAEYPLSEALTAVLMRTLHVSGRSAEALDCYAWTRQRLRDELGADPGTELQELHQAILRGDLAEERTAAPSLPAPAQLPVDVDGFTGRGDELDRLNAMWSAGGRPAAVVITAVSGTAGVGKTALAIHWAHRARASFPDGQLYVNLRGFAPSGSVTSPAEAIRWFLEALAVAPQRIPTDLDAQAALYRSLLADRRMLIVLDNARDAEQVRPLLAGARGCLVLITSRNRLTSLIAAEGARPLPLDVLSHDEARDLLAHRLGSQRITAEPTAVDEIITSCAHLPLALSIIAANAATQPRLPLAALADQLRHGSNRLDVLSTGDSATTDLRAVFTWSYRALDEDAACLFRLLGLHPGPDLSAFAAASLAGLPPPRVRPLLIELTRAHLLDEPRPGRFTFHDLLRHYANELAHTTDTLEDRRAATHRVLDHYLHSAERLALLLNPHRFPVQPPPPVPGVTTSAATTREEALTWFVAEHPALLAAVEHAAHNGFERHAWQLGRTLTTYLNQEGYWHDLATVQRTALTAAHRIDDTVGQAYVHGDLGLALIRLGHLNEAGNHYRLAVDLHRAVGNPSAEAHTHLDLAELTFQQGDLDTAFEHATRALTGYELLGDRRGQASALNSVGWMLAHRGEHRRSLNICERSVELYQQIDDPWGLAGAYDSLGLACHHTGRHQRAVDCFERSLALIRRIGDQYREADTLTHIGDTHAAAGNTRPANEAWQQAFAILSALDHPDAQQLSRKL